MNHPAEKLDRGPNTAGMWRGPDQAAPTPISEIGPKFRPHVLRHLLRLNQRDRYLRFGYVANDEQIQRYVNALNFGRDRVYAIFNHALEIVGMAHLAFAVGAERRAAEFGVSVTREFRGRGWGKRLFERAAVHAVNSGIDTLYIYALSENATMLHIARQAGAIIEQEGSDSEARVRLPQATFASRLDEIVAGNVGTVDFWLKSGTAALQGMLREPRADNNPGDKHADKTTH